MTFTLNFSRPRGNQVVGQLTTSWAGAICRIVMQARRTPPGWLGDQLREVDHCEVISWMVRRSRWSASGSPATAGTRSLDVSP